MLPAFAVSVQIGGVARWRVPAGAVNALFVTVAQNSCLCTSASRLRFVGVVLVASNA